MQNVTLKITGMSCGHCVKAVEGALKDLPGVTIHEVKIGSATLSLGPGATVEAVRKAIEEEGYEVVEVQ
jgi:copper chaperone